MEQITQVYLPHPDATKRLGLALAEAIDKRAVIALTGPLGAGKTALVQAVAQGLGIEELVVSPTFTMLNEYHSGRLPLYHMDLYRLSESKAPAPIDLLLSEMDEFLDENMVVMIEWAELLLEKGGSRFLSDLDHLILKLSYVDLPGDVVGERGAAGLEGGTASLITRARTHTRLPDVEAGPDQAEPSSRCYKETGEGLHINKDEEGRLAMLESRGKESSGVIQRLATNIADMLIYS